MPVPLVLSFDGLGTSHGRSGDDVLFHADVVRLTVRNGRRKGAIVTMTSEEVRFVQWRLARPQGSPWRRVADVERGDQHLGEIEACLSVKAAARLASELGRDFTDEELAHALMAYAEAYVRALLDQGEDLSDHSLIVEVDSEDRDVLRAYLPS
jgi:hypothetical protein